MLVLRVAKPAPMERRDFFGGRQKPEMIGADFPIGPYSHKDGFFPWCHPDRENSRHPMPESDGLGDGLYAHEVSGFASTWSLLDWFGYSAQEGRDAGFKVYGFRVPAEHVRHGKHQVAFDWRHAQEVFRREIPLSLSA